MKQSKVLFSVSGRKAKPLDGYAVNTMDDVEALKKLGIHITPKFAKEYSGFAMDAVPALTTTASIPTPVQFLQSWLPGFVSVMTQVRKADEIMGMTTIGSWHDEEVVQGIVEPTGVASPYFDDTNIPRSSWNLNFEKRTIVRFEEGLRVGKLEEARASEVNLNSLAQKRSAAALALDIERNKIAFYGYNSGLGNTYGFLNDPSLPSYTTVAVGAGGTTTWSTKTAQEIFVDIQGMVSSLRTNSKGLIDAASVPTTLVVSNAVRTYLDTPYNYTGIPVSDIIKKAYPAMRIESAPELDGANGGANAAYLFADSYGADSTDNGAVIEQLVPAKFITIGAMQMVKGFEEDYSNATAGVMVKRPWAVVRVSGI